MRPDLMELIFWCAVSPVCSSLPIEKRLTKQANTLIHSLTLVGSVNVSLCKHNAHILAT